ncbi:MAG: hypothetical protein QXU32_13520 [Nitrososphaerales archaeon]
MIGISLFFTPIGANAHATPRTITVSMNNNIHAFNIITYDYKKSDKVEVRADMLSKITDLQKQHIHLLLLGKQVWQ